MHERRWDIVLQLNDVESQCRNGQNLGAINRPVPLKFSCWCHAEFVGEMPPLVVVLMKTEDDRLYGFCSANEHPEKTSKQSRADDRVRVSAKLSCYSPLCAGAC